MSNEALLSNIIPFAGRGLLGYAMGFALKKILKWMLIIVECSLLVFNSCKSMFM
jgi:uncharacterized membrane protein (Fun14 family)